MGFYLLRSVKAFHQSSAKKRINKSTICPPNLAKCSNFFFFQMHQRWIMIIIRHCKIVCFMSRAYKQLSAHMCTCKLFVCMGELCPPFAKRLLYQQPEFCVLFFFFFFGFCIDFSCCTIFSHLHINLFICINICMLFDLAHPDPTAPPKPPLRPTLLAGWHWVSPKEKYTVELP